MGPCIRVCHEGDKTVLCWDTRGFFWLGIFIGYRVSPYILFIGYPLIYSPIHSQKPQSKAFSDEGFLQFTYGSFEEQEKNLLHWIEEQEKNLLHWIPNRRFLQFTYGSFELQVAREIGRYDRT